MTDVPIKDAATIVILRRKADRVSVLMGQRGTKAAFMPDKFVFPGGRVDETDHGLPGLVVASDDVRQRLSVQAPAQSADGITGAAIRELWEETGLILGQQQNHSFEVAPDWADFYRQGLLPDASPLQFFFRAVTPPGRPRRFDARFLMCDADAVLNDLDDFSAASGELSHLQWIDLEETRNFALPFITEIVLSEVADIVARPDQARRVPFFSHGVDGPAFRSI